MWVPCLRAGTFFSTNQRVRSGRDAGPYRSLQELGFSKGPKLVVYNNYKDTEGTDKKNTRILFNVRSSVVRELEVALSDRAVKRTYIVCDR